MILGLGNTIPSDSVRQGLGGGGGGGFDNTYSLAFDGVDDFINCGNDSSLNFGSALTVSAWVKPTNSINQVIASKNNSSTDGFVLMLSSGVPTKARFFIYIGGALKDLQGTTTITHDVWSHILAVNDGTDLKLYVNGVLDNTLSSGGGAIDSNSHNFIIGARADGTLPFDNFMDEVAVWNADKSSDVATIYNSGAPNDLTSLNPTAWYRMGDNGSYKSPQWLIPNNSNKDKVSNYSFEFDGVDDYIQLSSGISFASEFSLSVWIKPNGFSNNQVILGNGTSSQNWLRLSSASSITFKIANTSLSFADVGNNLVDGVWQHLLLYRDSSNNVGIFRNGSAFSTTQSNTNTLELSTFGKRGSIEYTGSIDDIAFWQSDKSSDVATIYNSGTPTTLPSGAVAHWKMGEQANFTDNWLVNNSALDNYSTRSFNFDGVDDYMTVATPTTLTDFTTSVWLHRTGNGNFDGIFGQDSSTAKGGILRYVSLDGTNITLYLTSGWTAMSGALAIDTWHHFALTYDSTANELKSYINGSLYTTISSPDFSGQNTNAHSFSRIGMRNGNTATSFPGLLDEIALWNTAKSASDITAIYNSGEPTTITGAIAHWRMGENATFNTNWSIPDQVGSSTVASVNMTISDLEGEAPNYTGGGLSANMTIEDRVGDAPNSTSNAVSYNMTESDRETDVPS